MKVALQTVGDKYDQKLLRSWKSDLEKAFIQLAPITIVKPTPWTPQLRGTSVAGSPTYAKQFGEWSQIDDRLFFNCYVNISAIGGMTGNVQLFGLPQPSRAVSNMYYEHVTRWNNVTLAAAGVAVMGQQAPGQSYLDMIELVNTGGAISLPVTALAATADFVISGSYAV